MKIFTKYFFGCGAQPVFLVFLLFSFLGGCKGRNEREGTPDTQTALKKQQAEEDAAAKAVTEAARKEEEAGKKAEEAEAAGDAAKAAEEKQKQAKAAKNKRLAEARLEKVREITNLLKQTESNVQRASEAVRRVATAKKPKDNGYRC